MPIDRFSDAERWLVWRYLHREDPAGQSMPEGWQPTVDDLDRYNEAYPESELAEQIRAARAAPLPPIARTLPDVGAGGVFRADMPASPTLHSILEAGHIPFLWMDQQDQQITLGKAGENNLILRDEGPAPALWNTTERVHDLFLGERHIGDIHIKLDEPDSFHVWLTLDDSTYAKEVHKILSGYLAREASLWNKGLVWHFAYLGELYSHQGDLDINLSSSSKTTLTVTGYAKDPLPPLSDKSSPAHFGELFLRWYADPQRMKRARIEAKGIIINDLFAYSYFARHYQFITTLTGPEVREIAVFGAGHRDIDDGTIEVHEPYEWAAHFPNAQITVFDGNPRILEYLSESNNRPRRATPERFSGLPKEDYPAYLAQFGIDQGKLPRSGAKFEIPKNVVKRVLPHALQFLTEPVPDKKFDLISCMNVLYYLILKQEGVSLAKAFLIQLADALKPSGRLVITHHSGDDPFLSAAEAAALGLDLKITTDQALSGKDTEQSDNSLRAYITYAKIGDGTPLLRELATQVKKQMRGRDKPGPILDALRTPITGFSEAVSRAMRRLISLIRDRKKAEGFTHDLLKAAEEIFGRKDEEAVVLLGDVILNLVEIDTKNRFPNTKLDILRGAFLAAGADDINRLRAYRGLSYVFANGQPSEQRHALEVIARKTAMYEEARFLATLMQTHPEHHAGTTGKWVDEHVAVQWLADTWRAETPAPARKDPNPIFILPLALSLSQGLEAADWTLSKGLHRDNASSSLETGVGIYTQVMPAALSLNYVAASPLTVLPALLPAAAMVFTPVAVPTAAPFIAPVPVPFC